MRIAGPILFGGLCLLLVRDHLATVETGAVRAALSATHPLQWALALAATALSFWALGRYDGVIHGHLQTGIEGRAARRSGAAAIALSQVLGMGVVTGALARWRMLPGLSPLDAARVSASVAVSFMLGWAVVAAAVDLVAPLNVLPTGAALAILAAALALTALAVTVPAVRLMGRRIALPPLRAIAAIVVLSAIDTAAAALALHVLLPPEVAPSFALLLPAYLFALGAALMTGTPGGVGPFELALLTLLPQVPQAEMVAAILAFRLVYYALPVCLALVPLARPWGRRRPSRLRPAPAFAPAPPASIFGAARAEVGVARQNAAMGLFARGSEAAVVETGQTLTLLFGATLGPLAPLLPALRREALSRNRVACAYKLSAQDALTARRMGWRVARIADEAVIDVAGFDTGSRDRRQLRRKLRNAEKAGVTAAWAATPHLPALAAIDARWCADHGGARGLTIGRFAQSYVAGQRIYAAERDGAIIAFATFHTGPEEWTLDLMRHVADLPDGTMQTLVAAALEDARTAGIPRLSLAAMPATPATDGRITARVRSEIAARSGGRGLTQFKMAFGPRRVPLYAAAPGALSLALALGDLALAVRRRPDHALEDASDAAPAIAFAPVS